MSDKSTLQPSPYAQLEAPAPESETVPKPEKEAATPTLETPDKKKQKTSAPETPPTGSLITPDRDRSPTLSPHHQFTREEIDEFVGWVCGPETPPTQQEQPKPETPPGRRHGPETR